MPSANAKRLSRARGDLFREEPKKVDHVLGLARELFPELRVLGRNPDGARVEVALAHHDAPERDKGGGRKAKLFGPEERGHHHVAAVLELPVRLQPHAAPQVVQHLFWPRTRRRRAHMRIAVFVRVRRAVLLPEEERL